MSPAVCDIITSAWTLCGAVLIGVIFHWLYIVIRRR